MPDDPDFLTIKECCAIIGGSRPISEPTFYRNPQFKCLIEHPTPGVSRVRRPKLLETINRETEAK